MKQVRKYNIHSICFIMFKTNLVFYITINPLAVCQKDI